jgi:UDP-sugar pyrophosphorylase
LGDESHQQLVRDLIVELGQGHLFASFSQQEDDNNNDKNKSNKKLGQFVEQLVEIDKSYSGGLRRYISNARKLLEQSQLGVNPLEGWIPSIPSGQTLQLDTRTYQQMEDVGRPLLGSVGFVLVAGGLGERLGYSGIKIGLPTELATETSYIQHYIEYILAVQAKYRRKSPRGQGSGLPLCIMTSSDTNDKTIELLETHQYFGMHPGDVTIVQQGKGVPALLDNEARIATETDIRGGAVAVVTKPHGHGDVHELLHRHGVAQQWLHERKLRYLVLFQDTNGLAFHCLPAMLGVSETNRFIMNSLAVPRRAGQAIGGIATLTHAETQQKRYVPVPFPLFVLCASVLSRARTSTRHPDGECFPLPPQNRWYIPLPGRARTQSEDDFEAHHHITTEWGWLARVDSYGEESELFCATGFLGEGLGRGIPQPIGSTAFLGVP